MYTSKNCQRLFRDECKIFDKLKKRSCGNSPLHTRQCDNAFHFHRTCKKVRLPFKKLKFADEFEASVFLKKIFALVSHYERANPMNTLQTLPLSTSKLAQYELFRLFSSLSLSSIKHAPLIKVASKMMHMAFAPYFTSQRSFIEWIPHSSLSARMSLKASKRKRQLPPFFSSFFSFFLTKKAF
jgi:hypothetical protein